jgi:UDP-N-acetylglucosamine diphosphorylase/glucosamine-1-phosphate N-acetyltransferase
VKGPSLVLFDDRVARDWRPFSLTRPIGELLFGIGTLRSRSEHALGIECAGHIAAPHLASFDEPWAPPVLDPGSLSLADGCVFLLSRYVGEPSPLPDRPALLICDGQVVGCRIGPGGEPPDPAFFDEPEDNAPDLPVHELPGRVLGRVWEVMCGNAERVARDLARADHAALSRDVHLLGDGPVSVGTGVRLAPGVVLDARDGPIRLDDDVDVHPFTRIAGPAYVGPGTKLFGGPFASVSIGPVCKVHGEMVDTVVLGYSNKAHDGFLGHAYLGLWVNLGALTTNSDLKNNYGPVRLWTPGGQVDTGQRKIGCFLGDHVKTAIGTLLNTGTVLEAGSNIFGGMPPKYVPPFSWGEPDVVYGLDRFLATAETVMGRRDIDLTDGQRRLLSEAWRVSRGERDDG